VMETARIVWQTARLVMREGIADLQRLEGRWWLNEYALIIDEDDRAWGSFVLQGHGPEDRERRTWWSLTIIVNANPAALGQVQLGGDIWIEPARAKARSVGEETITVPEDDPAFLTEPFVRKWVQSFTAMVTAAVAD
jgi:hypothetical protein